MLDENSKCFFDINEYEIEERDGVVLLLSSKYKNWLKTSKTGMDILSMLDGKTSLKEVAKKIAEQYEMPTKRITGDVIRFCNDLVNKNLINIKEKNGNHKYSNIYIDITNSCPFSCRYCNKKSGFDDRILTLEKFKERIEEFADKIEKEYTLINLTGGEPLINPHILEIIQYLGENGFSFAVYTSGYELNTQISDLILKYQGMVFLSLDSAKEDVNDIIRGKGTYKAAVDAAKILRVAGCYFYIATTPIKGYFHEVIDIIEFAYNLGALGIKINQPITIDVQGQEISNYFDYSMNDFYNLETEVFKHYNIVNSWRNNNVKKERKFSILPARFDCLNTVYTVQAKHNCGVQSKEVALDISGCQYPCYMLQSKKYCDCQLTEDFLDIDEECIMCKYKMFCLGGCKALDIYFPNSHTEYCSYAKQFYESLLWGE